MNDARNEIETLKLELENKDKALNECMNENVALKLSKTEKLKHCNHDCSKHDNRQYKKNMHILLAIIVEEKDIYLIIVLLIEMFLLQWEGFGFQKVPTYWLTTKDPSVWVPKSST